MNFTDKYIDSIRQPEFTPPPPRPVEIVNRPSPVGSPLPEGASADVRYAHNERVLAAARAFGQSQTPQPYNPSGSMQDNSGIIPPGLQAVVDKVLSRSTMGRWERQAAAHVAGSALSGVAAQGLQRRGAMDQTRLTEAGLGKRLGVTGATELEKQKMIETGATERAGIISKAPLMEQIRKAQPAQSFGFVPPTIGPPPAIDPPPEIGESWWERNRWKFLDY